MVSCYQWGMTWRDQEHEHVRQAITEYRWAQKFSQGGDVTYPYVVLAPGQSTRAVVRLLTGGLVRFCFRPGKRSNPPSLSGFVTRTGHNPTVFWLRTAVPFLRFLHHSLQLNIWVLIASWHDQYVDCAVLAALSPPAVRFAIGPILVE